MSGAVYLPAPAKLNLYLHIAGRRPDGLHELDSLVAFAGLADEVDIAEAERFSLTLSGPFAEGLSAGEDNLALEAARAVAALAGTGRAAALRIVKNIPVAAGLGGGSADAAAVLRGLAGLWRVEGRRLAEIGPGLGADVPVCLQGRPGFVGSIGERIDPAPALPPMGLLLVNTGVKLETGDVFAAFDEAGGAGGMRPRPALEPAPADARSLALALAGTANDLTGAARRLAPAIGDVLAALEAAPGCRLARMAGSGPTCFGLFDDPAGAAASFEEIRAARPDWWAWAGGLAGAA